MPIRKNFAAFLGPLLRAPGLRSRKTRPALSALACRRRRRDYQARLQGEPSPVLIQMPSEDEEMAAGTV